MKIVIDARMYQESGVGRYIRNLVSQLQKLDKENQYYLILLPKDKNIPLQNNFNKIIADFQWYGVSEQVKLPKLLDRINPDLVHFPHFNVPLFYSGKFVVTIHDLIHQHFAMKRATTLDPFTYKIKQWGYKTVFKNAINKSMKILVPSNFVKHQLIDKWKVRAEKIVITEEAVDDNFFSIIKPLSNQQSPYIFYVGNAHPHKNVEGLIKAFLEIRKKHKDLKLVLSGNDHYFWQRIKTDPRFRGNGIVYTGFINDKQLVALYKGALAFVMPSLEEGFGIPLLEAFACGCPVVSSKGGSLPEVGGEAAIYFDPKNIDDMVDKISSVLNNGKLRKELIEKGLQRVKLFSWERLAEQTLEVYLKCV